MSGTTKRSQINKKIGEGVSKMKPENIQKLKEAFAIDCTIEQACLYAEIAIQTYYNWTKKHPKLLEEFELLREKLPLRAKYNIAQKIEGGEISLSKWLLERKESGKYGEKLKIEHSGQIASDVVHPEDEQIRIELKKKLQDNIRRRAKAKYEPTTTK